MTAFADNLDANGYPKEMALPLAYAQSLENLLSNTRLRTRLAAVGNPLARELFDNAVHVEPLAIVDYVDADDSPTDSGDALHMIEPGVPSTLSLGGRWLYIGLDVRLAGAECTLYDLETDEQNNSTGEQEVTVECPPQPDGTKAMLVVKDAGIEVHRTELTVQAGAKTTNEAPRKRALAVGNAPGTGPVTLTGSVTAVAPTVDTTSGAHNYAATRSFTVKGVVVELLDRDANGAVLRDTNTDTAGRYSFAGLDAGRNVTVRVKAQLSKTRATGATTGAQWNLAVRDNTSTSSPKAMYVLDSAPVTTIAAGTQTADIVASLGFTADGTAGPDAARQSAPFSILEIAYSAMTKIEATDPNVVFPEVNFYWSPKNVGTNGNKELGQIDTSHYADSGTLAGVFILGKADVDTDEFDQGVIGHEFGHWLQSVLSSSDNPGGSHATTEFKDASLAYGEGYGTAVGGLLSGSPFYIDTSGVKQSGGGVTNLDLPTAAGVRKGFYSEESVQHVMYQIGKRHGFTAFWRAVSAMRADHYSSTVFAFLARFIAANPTAQVADLLATENIRSTDALGGLPAGTPPDASITAEQNKGESATGAGDLEKLYLPVTLPSVAAAAEPVALTPENPPTFCVNHNLKGAKLSNGLGMLKRVTFVANYTGSLGIKLADDKGKALDPKDVTVSARSDRGGKVRANEWDEAGADPGPGRRDLHLAVPADECQRVPGKPVREYDEPVAHAGLMPGRPAVLLAATGAATMLLLGVTACRDDHAAMPAYAVLTTASTGVSADAGWLGGPEKMSGKLRSGIVAWWRLEPPNPAAGVPFDLQLRLDEVKGDDAAVSVSTSDGARLTAAQATRDWTLPPGRDSLIRLQIVAPAGDSYLHLTTRQHGRSSVRSIRFGLPGAIASAPGNGTHTLDARGEPVVPMQANR